jgi:hypothetical protein
LVNDTLAVMQHTKARKALARAERMFAELSGLVDDTVAFQEHVPHVLDLLLNVTRVMDPDLRPENRDWWEAQKQDLWRELTNFATQNSRPSIPARS